MASPVDELVGSLVDGRYSILAPMASGSMGAVFKAERVPVGKIVAVKFLHASYANDSEFLSRFERETRVMSKLAHPNCVSVVDFGVWKGSPYLVMEFVNGRTLRTIIDQGPVAIPRALAFARQITAGLAHAHSHGITHRDVKPANLMISEEIGAGEHVRILDFGLARLRGAGGRDATQSNVVVGTPNYMAPEQTVGGGIIDARTDIYAVGVVLFEMIAGERPFKAEDTLSLLGMHRTAPVPRLTDKAKVPIEVPDALQEVIDTAMAKSPDDRYQTAIELAEAIDALGLRPPSPTDPKGLPVVRQPSTITIESTLEEADDSRSGAATAISSPRAAERRGATPPATEISAPPTMSEHRDRDRDRDREERKPARSTSKAGVVLALAVLGGGAYAAYYVQHRDAKGGSGGEVAVASGGSASGAAPDHGEGSGSAGATEPGSAGSAGSGDGSALAAGSGSAGSGDGSQAMVGSGAGPGSGSGSGSAGSGSAGDPAGTGGGEVDQAPDPKAATNPVPPRAGSAADTDEDPNAPKTQADVDKREKPAPPALATTIPDVIKLIKEGKRDRALTSLLAIYRQQPKSAYIPFLLGNLYFDQRWWSVAMENYKVAISRNPGYKSNAVLIGNVITMLVSKKTDAQAELFLKKTIGRPAAPYLQAAARSDPNPYIRKYAAALAKQIK